jgi:hypothetical protein
LQIARKYYLVYAERPIAVSLAVNIAFVADRSLLVLNYLKKEVQFLLKKIHIMERVWKTGNTPRLGREHYMHNI